MNDDEAVDVLSVPIQLLFLMSLTSLSSLHSVFGVWVLAEVFALLLGLQWIHEAFGRSSHVHAVTMLALHLGSGLFLRDPDMFSYLFGVSVLPWLVSGYTLPRQSFLAYSRHFNVLLVSGTHLFGVCVA